MFLMSIPRYCDEEIKRRYAHVKPVITVNGRLYDFRDYTVRELRELSYYFNRQEDMRNLIPADKLEVWEGHDFYCLHSFGYPGMFKPSIGEVLSQLTQSDLSHAKAFEIIEAPASAHDFKKTSFNSIAFNNGFHVSKVRLYIEKQKK